MDDGWKSVEVHTNGANGNGHGHADEAPETQQSLFSWAEFMAEEPVKPKGRKPKSQSATLSMFEWALTVEQEREKEVVGAGRWAARHRLCPTRAFATSRTGTAPSSSLHGASGAPPSPPTTRAGDDTWVTASRRGRGRRSTPTASRGSSRSFRPRPGPTPTASWCGPSPPPGPTGPTTGATRPSHPTLWDTCWPAVFTCRSILSTSYVPATPGESLPA